MIALVSKSLSSIDLSALITDITKENLMQQFQLLLYTYSSIKYVAYTVLVTEMYLFRGSNPCPILGLKGVYLHSQFLSNLLLKDCVFHHHFFKLYRGSASQIVFGCSLAIVYKYEIYLYLDSSYLSSK